MLSFLVCCGPETRQTPHPASPKLQRWSVHVNVPPRVSETVRGENGSCWGFIAASVAPAAAEGVHAERRFAVVVMRAVRRLFLQSDEVVCCLNYYLSYVRYEVISAVAKNNFTHTFWSKSCRPLKINRRFGGTCCPLLPASYRLIVLLNIWPWRWRQHVPPKRCLHLQEEYVASIFRRQHVPPKRWLNSKGLHGNLSGKTELSIICFFLN
jgi:hypothetical protein